MPKPPTVTQFTCWRCGRVGSRGFLTSPRFGIGGREYHCENTDTCARREQAGDPYRCNNGHRFSRPHTPYPLATVICGKCDATAFRELE